MGNPKKGGGEGEREARRCLWKKVARQPKTPRSQLLFILRKRAFAPREKEGGSAPCLMPGKKKSTSLQKKKREGKNRSYSPLATSWKMKREHPKKRKGDRKKKKILGKRCGEKVVGGDRNGGLLVYKKL